MALNAETKKCDTSGSREPKLKMRLWTSIWEVMTMLNAKTENVMRMALNTDTDAWWLWTPNEDAMTALNTETGNVTLNVKRKQVVALNAETENATVMALNAKTENVMTMALNFDTEKW